MSILNDIATVFGFNAYGAVSTDSVTAQAAINAGIGFLTGGPVGAAVAFAATVTLTEVQSRLAKDPGGIPDSVQQSSLGVSRQPIGPWDVWWGRDRKGGILTYRWISPDRVAHHFVITLACHRIKAIDAVLFNGEEVPLDADGNATGRFAGYVRVQVSLGDEGPEEQPFPDLVAETGGDWRATSKQYGHAKVYLRILANSSVFPTGMPDVSFIGRGALAYDPRTDDTEYTENPALLTTLLLTEPELTSYGLSADYEEEVHEDDLIAAADDCEARVLRFAYSSEVTADPATDVLTGNHRCYVNGTGVRFTTTGTLPAPLLPDTTYYAFLAGTGIGSLKLATTYARAIAGTTIDITDTGTGAHTLVVYDEPRYVAGGAWTTAMPPREILGRLLASYAGTCCNQGDQWHITAGVYHAPSVTLSERDMVGGGTVDPFQAAADSFNGAKGIVVDPLKLFQPDDFTPIESDAYLEEDRGIRQWGDIDLTGFVRSPPQARRVAKIALLTARQSLTEEQGFRLKAWGCVPGRTVTRSDTQFGWTKVFKVLESELALVADDDGNVAIVVRHTLREDAAAIYDWSTDEDLGEDIAPNTVLPDPFDVPAPGIVDVDWEMVETRDALGYFMRMIVTVGRSTYPYSHSYQLEHRASGDTLWKRVPLVTPSDDEDGDFNIEVDHLAPGSRDVRVKAVGLNGAQSAYARRNGVALNGVPGAPATPVIESLTIHGNKMHLVLQPTTSLDVKRGGRRKVRWSPSAPASASWAGSTSIGRKDGWPGTAIELVLPLRKDGTVLVKDIDSTGQRSAVAKRKLKGAREVGYTTVTTISE